MHWSSLGVGIYQQHFNTKNVSAPKIESSSLQGDINWAPQQYWSRLNSTTLHDCRAQTEERSRFFVIVLSSRRKSRHTLCGFYHVHPPLSPLSSAVKKKCPLRWHKIPLKYAFRILERANTAKITQQSRGSELSLFMHVLYYGGGRGLRMPHLVVFEESPTQWLIPLAQPFIIFTKCTGRSFQNIGRTHVNCIR